jgi:hypothetical protein
MLGDNQDFTRRLNKKQGLRGLVWVNFEGFRASEGGR